jgi:hypothetical protein
MGGVLSEFLNDMRVEDTAFIHKEDSDDGDVEIYQ